MNRSVLFYGYNILRGHLGVSAEHFVQHHPNRSICQRRKRLFWVSVAFIAVALFLLAQLFWVCEPDPSWKDAPNPQCKLPLQVAVCQVVTDTIADSILLFAPLPLFRNLVDKALRRKLTLIFSTCVVTTVVSLVHAAFILRNGRIKVVISALVEDCLSLIVANFPVIVTTMIDIVGDTDQAHASRTTSFSTMFWYTDTGTNRRGVLTAGAIESVDLSLHIASDERADEMELSDTNASKRSLNSWIQNGSEQRVVDTISSNPAADRRSYPYPTSPL
ncbi:hypothetical protein K438DRAFT_1959312 [Mycena galopus ATCC 62051]|nr:hypothetical protein K438DRAFT_1959312 [Mycena galopus ATCC 62051]